MICFRSLIFHYNTPEEVYFRYIRANRLNSGGIPILCSLIRYLLYMYTVLRSKLIVIALYFCSQPASPL